MSERLTNLFLKRRGYTQQVLHDLNDGKHQKLLNIDKLADILKQAHDCQSRIVVMPDFDADGTTAGSLGFAGLSELGFKAGLYEPDETKGYGIHKDDVDILLKRFPDVKYIISCDVGITCYEAFDYAYSKGIKVLITDHHEEEKESVKPMPLKCETIVDPCQLKETYPLRDICGAFVFWQVLDYYAKKYDTPFKQEQISRLRVFAGIGTEGDRMPIVKENRVLLKQTISLLRFIYNNGMPTVVQNLPGCTVYKRAFYGLFCLMRALNKADKLRGGIDEDFLGFYVVPVFNSIKRMEQPMRIVFGTFFADKANQEAFARKMVETNSQRQDAIKYYDEVLTDEIDKGQQKNFPYVFTTKAQSGIIGLVAQKQINRTGVPTFVINMDTLSGSGRTPSYFPAFSLFQDSDLVEIKGHEFAFGIQFKDKDAIGKFVKEVDKLTKKLSQNADQNKFDSDLTLTSDLSTNKSIKKTDGVLDLDDCWDFYNDTQRLRPFGEGFDQPVVKVFFKTDRVEYKLMGQEKQHLKIILADGLELIAWNKGDDLDKIQKHNFGVFYGYFSVNSFRGKISLQMVGDFGDMDQQKVA